MREYLTNSNFYLKIFSVDPDFKAGRLLNLTMENNHAFITLGFPHILPDSAPINWNKNNFNSTKIVISFQFVKNISVANISLNKTGWFEFNKNTKQYIEVIFCGDAGNVNIVCEFISIGGIIPYNE